MNELAYNIIEYIMIACIFLSIVLAIIACIFLVKESKKLTNSKVVVYTYRIGQRPSVFDIKKFKHTSYLFKQGFNDFIKEVEQNKNDKYLFSDTGRLYTREKLKIKQFTSDCNLVLNSKSEEDYKNQIKFKNFVHWLKSLNFEITLLSNETEVMFIGLNIKGYASIKPESSIYQKIAIDNIACFNKVSRCPVITYLSDNSLMLDNLYSEFKSLGSKEGYELSNHDEYKPNFVENVRW